MGAAAAGAGVGDCGFDSNFGGVARSAWGERAPVSAAFAPSVWGLISDCVVVVAGAIACAGVAAGDDGCDGCFAVGCDVVVAGLPTSAGDGGGRMVCERSRLLPGSRFHA